MATRRIEHIYRTHSENGSVKDQISHFNAEVYYDKGTARDYILRGNAEGGQDRVYLTGVNTMYTEFFEERAPHGMNYRMIRGPFEGCEKVSTREPLTFSDAEWEGIMHYLEVADDTLDHDVDELCAFIDKIRNYLE